MTKEKSAGRKHKWVTGMRGDVVCLCVGEGSCYSWKQGGAAEHPQTWKCGCSCIKRACEWETLVCAGVDTEPRDPTWAVVKVMVIRSIGRHAS